jgi:NADPH-dependent F420 reductase
VHIGILGGTGPAGNALAARLASVGFDVVVGSRSAERAEQIVADLRAKWPDRQLTISSADNPGAAACEVVAIATPWDAAAPVALSVKEALGGKIVLSMANALTRIAGEFEPLIQPRGSVAAGVQAVLPDSRVVIAFHHIPARDLGDLRHPVDGDVLVCSDHPDATEEVAALVAKVPELRPLDAGPLAMASPIESFTAVLLQLNQIYRTRVSLKFTGLPE